MNHVFANRVRVCVFRLLFLLAGFSVTPTASAQIDPADTYCSNYMYGVSENTFFVEFKISISSYNSGWEAPAYTYLHVGQYNCEIIRRSQMDVCIIYEVGGNVDCDIGYALTGGKFRGSNPWYGNSNSQDSSLNPSNSYMRYDGTFNRGMNCTEGEHVYTPLPKGYRYVPFDGFKYLHTDYWSSCLYDALESSFGEWDFHEQGIIIRSYGWSSTRFSTDTKTCSSLDHDCLYVVIEVQPHWFDDDSTGHYTFRGSGSFYARCPPNSQFSPVHGACYVVEADELLAGTGVSDTDLYGQPGGADIFHVNFDSVDLLSQISKPGIDVCPSPLTTTFRGQTITFFDYTDACQMLGDYVRPFVLLLGGFISIAIVLGISTASATSNEG